MADEMQGTDGTLEIIASSIRVFPCDPWFKHLRDGCEGGQCLAASGLWRLGCGGLVAVAGSRRPEADPALKGWATVGRRYATNG